MANWKEIIPHEVSIYTEIHQLDLGDNFIISIYKGRNNEWYKKVKNVWGNKITLLLLTENNDNISDSKNAKLTITNWVQNYIESELFRLNRINNKLLNHSLENVKLH